MGMVLGKRYAILLDNSFVAFPIVQVLLRLHDVCAVICMVVELYFNEWSFELLVCCHTRKWRQHLPVNYYVCVGKFFYVNWNQKMATHKIMSVFENQPFKIRSRTFAVQQLSLTIFLNYAYQKLSCCLEATFFAIAYCRLNILQLFEHTPPKLVEGHRFWVRSNSRQFRDRRSRIVFFGNNSRNIESTSTSKYCKKGFRDVFQMSPTKKCVCLRNVWENQLFLLTGGNFLAIFRKKFHAYVSAFLKRFLALTACKDYD